MPKKGFTIITVSKDLYDELYRRTRKLGMSIPQFIKCVIGSLNKGADTSRVLVPDLSREEGGLGCSLFVFWSPGRDSNPRPPPYQGGALPA